MISKSGLKLSFFEIQNLNHQTLLNEKLTKMKLVHLDDLYNFYIHDLFSSNHILFQNVVTSWNFFEIQILSRSNKVKWQDDKNKICTSWWVIQLWYLKNFNLRSFSLLKFYSKFQNLKFQFLEIYFLFICKQESMELFI